VVGYHSGSSLSGMDCKRVGRLSLRRERGRVRVLLRAPSTRGLQTPHLNPLPLPKGRGGKTFLKTAIKPAGR